GLNPARADDAAFLLSSFYRRSGYAQVAVKYEIHGNTLVLIVNEGPLAFIRTVRYFGNDHHNDNELSQFLLGVAPDKIAAQHLKYDVGEIGAGVDRIRGFYLSEGWLDVDVQLDDKVLSHDGTAADLVIRISEGTQYHMGAITFSAAPGFTP